RMAELRDLQEELERERGQLIEPPWSRFTQLVHHCRGLATEVAKQTGKHHAELVEYIRSQERFAERAYQDRNQALYRECWAALGDGGRQGREVARRRAHCERRRGDDKRSAGRYAVRMVRWSGFPLAA